MSGSPARPARSGEELVAAVPELDQLAPLRVRELSNVPGVNMDPPAAARAVCAAADAIEGGAAGAVITQGTDTIEETAELADLCWPHEEPLAITGAIRAGGSAAPDGPLNLLDAVRFAADRSARGLGPAVVFDGLAHPAAQAVKSHSWRSDAFDSPTPLAEIREGHVRPLFAGRPVRRPLAAPAALMAADLDSYVPILAAAAGMGSRPLDALRGDGARGLVVLALGAGHLPEAMLAGVDRALAAGLPVVICARPARGGTLERTYGFEGSETDLAARGAILAGRASPWKARIRLLVALGLREPPADLFATA